MRFHGVVSRSDIHKACCLFCQNYSHGLLICSLTHKAFTSMCNYIEVRFVEIVVTVQVIYEFEMYGLRSECDDIQVGFFFCLCKQHSIKSLCENARLSMSVHFSSTDSQCIVDLP